MRYAVTILPRSSPMSPRSSPIFPLIIKAGDDGDDGDANSPTSSNLARRLLRAKAERGGGVLSVSIPKRNRSTRRWSKVYLLWIKSGVTYGGDR